MVCGVLKSTVVKGASRRLSVYPFSMSNRYVHRYTVSDTVEEVKEGERRAITCEEGSLLG